MRQDIFASIIICSHRRPESLELALESLAREEWNGDDWEVLVIENDREPTAEVADVVRRFENRLPIKAYLETVPNLSRARNLGAEKARGEYLAYLDDDVEVEPGWLQALCEECREFRPDFCAGPSYPLYRSPKPYWYCDEWGSTFCLGDEAKRIDEAPAGMNFIAKREIVQSVGGFREQLGMAGNKIAYGEETDLVMRAREARPGLVIVYLPKMAVRHEVRPIKMTILWSIRSAWAGGRDFVQMGGWSDGAEKPLSVVYVLLSSAAIIALGLPRVLGIMIVDVFRPGRSLWRRYVRGKLHWQVVRLAMGVAALRLVVSGRRRSTNEQE